MAKTGHLKSTKALNEFLSTKIIIAKNVCKLEQNRELLFWHPIFLGSLFSFTVLLVLGQIWVECTINRVFVESTHHIKYSISVTR
jgi:hypothetical protein